MDEEIHCALLQTLCRLCGSSNSRRYVPKQKLCTVVKKSLDIDISNDEQSVHPPQVCQNCERKLQRWKEKRNKKIHKEINITVYQFQQHCENCSLCSDGGHADKKWFGHVISEAQARNFLFKTREDGQILVLSIDAEGETRWCLRLSADGDWSVNVYGRNVNRDIFDNVPSQICSSTHVRAIMDQLQSFHVCPGSPEYVLPQYMLRNRPVYIHYSSSTTTIRYSSCPLLTTEKSRCIQCRIYRSDLARLHQKYQGSGTAGQGARRSGSRLSDWLDVSVDDDMLGWEMEDEESSSPLQGEQRIESSHRNPPRPSESQDWTPLPGQASNDEGHASQRSVGQDAPPGSKRRKLQAAYCVPPPVEEHLPHQSSQTRNADPKVVILTPDNQPVQLSTSTTGQNSGTSTDSVKIVSIEDMCYTNTVVQAETEPYPALVQKADYGDGGLISTSQVRGSLSSVKSPCTAGEAASTTPAPREYSSSEDQGPLDYCFTCEDPLLSSDSGKKNLLAAVRGKTKVLHILHQIGWPGLYSHDCRFWSCCGDCAQLLCEYNDMLRALHALKGKWIQWTGHNSAPHFNQFHHEAFMTRDSCIESSRHNCVSTEKRNQHIQGVASHHQGRPHKEQLSNQFTDIITVNDHPSGSEDDSSPKDSNGVCQDLNSGHVSDVESPYIEDPHQDGEPHQVSDPNKLLKEHRKLPVDVESAECPCIGPQILPSQHHKLVLETTSTPHTVPETSEQASQSHHKLQPGFDDYHHPSKTPGQRVTGKDGLSDKEDEMRDRGTTKRMTTCPDSASDREMSMQVCDNTPPKAAPFPDKQIVQGQKEDVHDNDDVGPKTDHNFDPGQDQLSVTIKQEQENFAGDEVYPEASDPGGSGLNLQSLDTRWDSPDGR